MHHIIHTMPVCAVTTWKRIVFLWCILAPIPVHNQKAMDTEVQGRGAVKTTESVSPSQDGVWERCCRSELSCANTRHQEREGGCFPGKRTTHPEVGRKVYSGPVNVWETKAAVQEEIIFLPFCCFATRWGNSTLFSSWTMPCSRYMQQEKNGSFTLLYYQPCAVWR